MSTEYGYEDLRLIINEGQGRQSVLRWQANVLCLLSAMLFFGVRVALTMYEKPKFVKASVDFWNFRNIFISWLHSVVLGAWITLCFWWHPEIFEDPVFYLNDCIYLLVPFSVGYFIYDLIDIVTSNNYRNDWGTVLHHLFIISGMSFIWNVKLCVGYGVIALIGEINSIFLHLRKLLQFSGIGFDSVPYRVVSILNLSTFVLFRFIPHSRCLYGFVIDYHRLPISFLLPLLVIFPLGVLINIGLFWLVFKSDVLRPMIKGCNKKE